MLEPVGILLDIAERFQKLLALDELKSDTLEQQKAIQEVLNNLFSFSWSICSLLSHLHMILALTASENDIFVHLVCIVILLNLVNQKVLEIKLAF